MASRPRIRWRYLLTCLGVAIIALIVTLVVGAALPEGDNDVSSHANPFTTTTFQYLLVIVLLTPFQAAGEEYLFRGYLTQAFGGVFHRAWVAVLVPAFLFGLAHGLGQSPPVFFDRFAFGVVAGILVIRTGGLEAGIAMHVLNNFLAYGLALAFGDMASTLNPTGGDWWTIPVTLTQSLVYLGLAVAVSRRMGLSTSTDRRILEASERRV
jgi:membrane protease YdiL (CAAX protease family)